MNLVWNVLLPFLGGLGLGAFFFGGLWLTVRRGLGSARAHLWFAVSSLLRTAATLYGMYLLTDGRWQLLLPCVAGFYCARHAVTRIAGAPPAEEDAHAS